VGTMSHPSAMTQALTRVWHAWRETASYIGDFQARLLLTVFYFTIAAPFALLTRLLDPLRLRAAGGTSAWLARPEDQQDLHGHRRQF
jgi:hypothetical protein